MLKSETIRIFNSIGYESDRPRWKLKDISPGLVNALSLYVKLTDLLMLDRGAASLIIDCVFKLIRDRERVTDFKMLDELNNIISSGMD